MSVETWEGSKRAPWMHEACDYLRLILMAAWPISLVALGLRARVALGHWPSYSMQGSEDLSFLDGHSDFTWLMLFAFGVAVLTMPSRFGLREWPSRTYLAAYSLFVALGCIVFIGNPGGLTEWFLD